MNLRLASCALSLAAALQSLHAQPASPDTSHLASGKGLRDSASGITYCLEPDQHHVFALADSGEILWLKDLAQAHDKSSHFYGGTKIVYFSMVDPKQFWRHQHFGKPGDFIEIGYNTTAFGLIRKKDGSFIFLGQD